MSEKLIFKSVNDMPPMAVSLSNMNWNRTGSWRYMRPVYQYKTAPCIPACPAGEKIPRYLRELVNDDPHKAWSTIIKDNPFPSVCGRVCRHPCEAACNRMYFDEPIAIRALEKHVGDYGRAHGKFEPVILEKGKRVAVVGAGATGLTCAFNLRLAGYEVDVFEAKSEPGGNIRYRIPYFRLPHSVIDDEIDLILKTGVKVRTGVEIGKDRSFDELLDYDAVFVSTGSWKDVPPGIEGENLDGVLSAKRFLSEVNCRKHIPLGNRVAVVGHDDSAIDAARTLVRLKKRVLLICEKSKNDISAPPLEVADAVAEGVEMRQLTLVSRLDGEGGRVSRLECVRVAPGKPDSSGRRKTEPVEGSHSLFEIDGAVICHDSHPVFDFLPGSLKDDGGSLILDEMGRTPDDKVFAGGEGISTVPGSIPDAVATGKRLAAVIDASLQGKQPKDFKSKRETVRFDTLNLLYFRKAARPPRDIISPDRATGSFDEYELPMSSGTALHEANRCMSCGICTECNNCLIFCPDVAISKLRKGYRIDYDYCKGCGICVHECPRNCMSLVEEMKWKK